jgi:DNA-binding CsgD family transcriptional regulator
MKNFQEMIECSTISHSDAIQRFCQPLDDHFGINYFWYYKISNDGSFNCFGNHIEWMEHCYANKLYLANPYLRHPSFYSPGINLLRKANNPTFQDSIDLGKKLFNVDLSLVTIEKCSDGIEGFGFATCLEQDQAVSMYLAEMPKLMLFSHCFKKEFNRLIEATNRDPANLRTAMGKLFDTSPTTSPKPKEIDLFLKKLGVHSKIPLTSREKGICSFLLDGYSAAQIASELSLSKRTIEHAIENIKDKLHLTKKMELISKLNELSKLGNWLH